jgi:hypothetical protein
MILQSGKSDSYGAIYVIAVAIALVAFGKIWMMAEFGAFKMGPDTRFIETARHMLTESRWLTDAGLTQEAMPHSLWKTVGYSALIAVFMKIFGASWYWWLYAFQGLMSIVAGLFLYRVAIVLRLGLLLSALVFLLHQFSTPFSTDALIATNSLDGSLATIVLASLGHRFLKGLSLGVPIMATYGVLIGICFFMRLSYEYWVWLLAAVLLLLVHQGTRSWRRSLIGVGAFLFVAFGIIGAYKTWNYLRTGHFIASTGGQTAYALNIVMLAKRVSPEAPGAIVADNTTLDRAIREALHDASLSDYEQAKTINRLLFEKYNVTAIDIQNLVFRRYLDLAIAHPVQWLQMWFKNARWLYQGSLFTGPVFRYDDMLWWKQVYGIANRYQGWRAEIQDALSGGSWRDLSYEALAKGGLRFGLRLVGLTMLLFFLAGTLRSALVWLQSGLACPEREVIVAAYGALYFLTASMFAVHFVEHRYLSCVVGAGILAIAILTRQSIDYVTDLRRRKLITGPLELS